MPDSSESPNRHFSLLSGQFAIPRGRGHRLWNRRGFRQIAQRWAVAPLMLLSIGIAHLFGFKVPIVPLICVAASIPAYNCIFAWLFHHHQDRLTEDRKLEQFLTLAQVVFDYVALFLIIYYTGGVWSPLIIFLVFHVIITALFFSPAIAHGLAITATAGLWLLWFGQTSDWIPREDILFRGEPLHSGDTPVDSAVTLLFFTATLFLTAAIVRQIMRRLRARVRELAEVTDELAGANDKLSSLYAIVRAIGAERQLDPILKTITTVLAQLMDVPAVAIKLLAKDGKTLHIAAANGLPDDLISESVVHLASSPLNQRILAGETLVQGPVSENDPLQLQEELTALGIKSAVLAPLDLDDRIIGTLGIYSHDPDRFRDSDARFLRLAAQLSAIAIENALSNEAIDRLMEERTQFMLQVAHNMRAPLGAGRSMLDLLDGGYLGDLSEKQADYIHRIDTRLSALDRTIAEILTIARARDWSHEIPDVTVSIPELAEHTEKLFRGDAQKKGIHLHVVADESIPDVDSGADLLEQVMENLVSNAIKYTPENGRVEVEFAMKGCDHIQITVRDSGIGIPAREQGKLFTEFFRASNAKKFTSAGTGLGLALVKQSVERHNGDLFLASEEGEGTTIVITLPIRQQKHEAD